jgi:signal peptidase I
MSTATTSIASRGLRLLGNALAYLLLIVSALAATVLIIVPIVTGSQTYSVLTNSMAPGYPPGTFLVVKPTPFEDLSTGDVITYQIESGQPEVITHRIVSTAAGQNGERLLVTRGDNNDSVDAMPVAEVQVRGELFYAVPYVGYAAGLLGQAQRGWAVTALAFGLIAYGIASIVRGCVHRDSPRDVSEDSVPAREADSADAAEGLARS